MKYSTKEPMVCMMTTSAQYKESNALPRMTIKGVLWHSTGANNPWLKRYVQPSDNAADRNELLKLIGKNYNGNDWNHKFVDAGVSAWIGKLADGTVASVQAMPWDFKQGGCGSGINGSCNNGWIQFEICEDDLTDARYANEVYKEACELTAYLCKKFNINPNGVATINGIKVPTIICHWDSYQYGLGSGHVDVYHWFPRYGKCLNKDMASVRNDVAELLNDNRDPAPTPPPVVNEQMYRVRKTWEDKASQIGAFRNLESAKKMCDEHASEGYNVFDKNGMIVYAPNRNHEYTQTDFVKDIQSALHVTVDGIAGPVTLGATPTISASANYRHGTVKYIQRRLNDLGFNCGEVDGVFGYKTQAGVIAYQKSFGGVADGEITRSAATWKHLLGIN